MHSSCIISIMLTESGRGWVLKLFCLYSTINANHTLASSVSHNSYNTALIIPLLRHHDECSLSGSCRFWNLLRARWWFHEEPDPIREESESGDVSIDCVLLQTTADREAGHSRTLPKHCLTYWY